MKFGDLIKRDKWVVILIHTAFKNVDRDFLSDLSFDLDFGLYSIDTEKNPSDLVSGIKKGSEDLEFVLYHKGILVDRLNVDHCDPLEDWISNKINH